MATLLPQKEICVDTETTALDANEAELVGISFSYQPHEAFYIPFPSDKATTQNILLQLQPLFNDVTKVWIGQNIKYDLLVLNCMNVVFWSAFFCYFRSG